MSNSKVVQHFYMGKEEADRLSVLARVYSGRFGRQVTRSEIIAAAVNMVYHKWCADLQASLDKEAQNHEH